MQLPPRTFKKKWDRQHGRCFYCGHSLLDAPIEIDHIIPRSVSRNSSVKNLCLSCKACNRLKGNKSLEAFKTVMPSANLIRGMFYFEFINIYPTTNG